MVTNLMKTKYNRDYKEGKNSSRANSILSLEIKNLFEVLGARNASTARTHNELLSS